MYAYSPTFLQNFTLGRILSRFYDFFELTGRLKISRQQLLRDEYLTTTPTITLHVSDETFY